MKIKINKILASALTLGSVLSIFAGVANAQLPKGTPITLTSIEAMVARIGDFLITISTVLGVIFIVWAGITYMAAGPDPKAVGDARQRLLTAVIGILIIFGVGTILHTVAGIADQSFFCSVGFAGVCIY